MLRIGLMLSAALLVGVPNRVAIAAEVDDDLAYVQSTELEDGGLTIKAKIKIKKSGTYVIAGGCAKKVDGKIYFHVGSFTGTKYYETKSIKADAGDVLDVTFKIKKLPPLNRTGYVGVFATERVEQLRNR